VVDELLRFLGASAIETLQVTTSTAASGSYPTTLGDGVQIAPVLSPVLLLSVSAEEETRFTDEQVLTALFSGELSDALSFTAAFVSDEGSLLTWAVNVSTGAVSEYRNFNFTSYAKVGRRYWATGSEGLYELNGDVDDGDPIQSIIRSGIIQLNGDKFASPDSAYLAMRGEGEVYLRIQDCAGKTFTYKVSVDSMRAARAKLGRGLKLRYFSFELETMGQDFDLESIEFLPVQLSRRI
jgi:hypothetical protein